MSNVRPHVNPFTHHLSNMKPHWLVLPIFLVLTGCAGSRYAEVKKNERLREYAQAGFGVAVVSVGHEKNSPYRQSYVVFRLKGTEDLVSFGYNPKTFTPSQKDFESSESSGTVVAKRLPPGEYEAQFASGDWADGVGQYSARMQFSPTKTFTVESGRVAYLGRFVLTNDGSRFAARVGLKLTDEMAVDLQVAKTREAVVSTQNVKSFFASMSGSASTSGK